MSNEDWRTKPASEQLVALAFGGAARIAVRYGLTADQAAKLMRSAWSIVQDESGGRKRNGKLEHVSAGGVSVNPVERSE